MIAFKRSLLLKWKIHEDPLRLSENRPTIVFENELTAILLVLLGTNFAKTTFVNFVINCPLVNIIIRPSAFGSS